MSDLVSILIPAFNAGDWLGATIKSALAQTWANKEIIVVDDGSTDNTADVARWFSGSEIKLIRQQNQGAASARNTAFAASRGDYIQWLDADDLLSSDKISRQMEIAHAAGDTRLLLSCGWASFHCRPSKAKFSPTLLWADLTPDEWLLRKWEGNFHMQTATWLVSRELSQAAGPWDTRLLGDDDGEYFSRVINLSSGIRFVQQGRVYYRITPSSRLSYIGSSKEKMEAQFLGMKLQIARLRRRLDNDRSRRACVTYLRTWLHNFYPNRPDIVEEARQIAATLGERLSPPEFSWKYAWIEKLFGFSSAKSAELYYNQFKSIVLRAWDKAMSSFERSGSPNLPGL